MSKKNAWDVARGEGISGTGNWRKFDVPFDVMEKAAQKWREKTTHLEKPWLCWNMNDDWCYLQQKIIRALGWNPVVGWDPNCGTEAPPLVEGAVAVDFNADLKLSTLWQHVPLEFAFLWTDKLAFWHADMLVRFPKLQKIGRLFDKLKDGEIAAVMDYGGLRNIWKIKHHRYWELIGCTTRGASRDQFDKGCGWWRHFWAHPNCPDEAEKIRRKKYYYDQGVGIMYWKRRHGGKVYSLSLRSLAEGHFSEIGAKNYRKGDSKSQELTMNFDLAESAVKLGLKSFLEIP